MCSRVSFWECAHFDGLLLSVQKVHWLNWETSGLAKKEFSISSVLKGDGKHTVQFSNAVLNTFLLIPIGCCHELWVDMVSFDLEFFKILDPLRGGIYLFIISAWYVVHTMCTMHLDDNCPKSSNVIEGPSSKMVVRQVWIILPDCVAFLTAAIFVMWPINATTARLMTWAKHLSHNAWAQTSGFQKSAWILTEASSL